MTTDNHRCYDPEFQLLGTDPLDNSSPTDTTHAFRTAPIVTADALDVLGPSVFPQRALYGRIIAQRAAGFATRPDSPKVYINTNAPFSALVCGVQVPLPDPLRLPSELIVLWTGLRKESLHLRLAGKLPHEQSELGHSSCTPYCNRVSTVNIRLSLCSPAN